MRVLALDFTPDELRIARAERILGTTRLIEVRRLPPGELATLVRPRPGRVFATVPTATVTHRVLALPFRDRPRLARTVPLDLRGRLAAETEETVVAFDRLGVTADGTTVLAAAARRADVEAQSALLEAAGFPKPRLHLSPLPAWNLVPAALADVALLVADGDRSTLSVRRGGRLAGLRSLGAATPGEVGWTLAALGPLPPLLLVAGGDASPDLIAAIAGAAGTRALPLTDVAPGHLHGPDALACAVAAGLALGGSAPAIVFSGEPDDASLRRIAALAALALTLGAVDVALVRHGLARRDARLVDAIRAEAAAVLPGARLVAPRAELAAAVTAAEQHSPGRGSVLGLLRELTLRAAPGRRLELDEVSVAPDAVRLHGRAESFEAVDALRGALARSALLADVAADETRPSVDGHGVEFRVHARRQDGGAPS